MTAARKTRRIGVGVAHRSAKPMPTPWQSRRNASSLGPDPSQIRMHGRSHKTLAANQSAKRKLAPNRSINEMAVVVNGKNRRTLRPIHGDGSISSARTHVKTGSSKRRSRQPMRKGVALLRCGPSIHTHTHRQTKWLPRFFVRVRVRVCVCVCVRRIESQVRHWPRCVRGTGHTCVYVCGVCVCMYVVCVCVCVCMCVCVYVCVCVHVCVYVCGCVGVYVWGVWVCIRCAHLVCIRTDRVCISS